MDVEQFTNPTIILALTVFIAKTLYEWLVASNKHLKDALEENTKAVMILTAKIELIEQKIESFEQLENTVNYLKRKISQHVSDD